MRRVHIMVAICLIGILLGVPLVGGFLWETPTAVLADSVLSVFPATAVTGTAISVSITANLPSTLISGSYSIDVGFDVQDTASTAMFVPSSMAASSVTINGQAISVYNAPTPSGHHVVMNGVSLVVGSTSTIQVSFGSAAGLKPLTDGMHYVSLAIALGSTIVASYSGTYQSSGGAVTGVLSLQAVNMDSTQLGTATSLGFDFISGSALYPSDQIFIQFPVGFAVPLSLPTSSVGMIETALGKYVNSFGAAGIVVNGSTVVLTIPQLDASIGNNASYFDASLVIGVRFGITAGFAIPATAGSYTFRMWTSRQATPATKTITFGTAVSAAQLTAVPMTSGAAVTLTGSCTTSVSGAMAAGMGSVSLSFPANFALPVSIPKGMVTVNGQPADAVVAGHVLKITVPAAVPAQTGVSFVISTGAGLMMPPDVAGGYTVSLSTSADAIPMPCPVLNPVASRVSGVNVSVLPSVKGAAAAFTVSFTTGAGGALGAGDTISLFLPYGFMVPSTIDRTQITIKTPATASSGIQPASVVTSPSAQSIVLTLPSAASIAGGSTVAVSLPAVITNPSVGGVFTAKVSTSKETTAVDSASFTIFNNPVSTLKVTPVSPDGKGGYYTSQPSFTLVVDGPAGTTLSAFYRIDEAGSFTSYNLQALPAVKIPEGSHTVFYYSQDGLGNVEPTRTQQFLVDLTDPVITVASPVQGSVVVQSSANVAGKIKALDPAGVVLSVGGLSTPVASDGSFSAVVTLKHEGVNPVDIVATSASGRMTTLTLSVNYIARVTMSLVIGSPTVNLNNEFKTLEAAPFISKKGVTMVPLRFISEAFKAGVVWDPVFKSVTLTLGGKIMRIQVGFLTADVSGKSFALQDAPVIVKGRTFVPLRFIAENFGAQVEWNAALKMVSIVYPKP